MTKQDNIDMYIEKSKTPRKSKTIKSKSKKKDRSIETLIEKGG